MNRYLLPLIGFVVLVGFLGVGLKLDPKKIPSPLVDKLAPAFAVPTLHNTQKSIGTEQLLGEVWLLNVWASWCAACRVEHPLIVSLANQSDVTLVGLNYKDKRPEALNWLQQFGDPYHHIAFDLPGDIGIDYGVYGVPESFLVDKKGRIRFKQIGPFNPQIINEQLIPMITQLQNES
ncbi:MAG: cytochrome c biogenesis protein CcmG/thiol:disulfide interchange protein DsbE [Gammaproteobacteria bacterium]|jgi:cytochrome c biogenesis protein CcmG/thiol:disulfide interchange protein DsbE